MSTAVQVSELHKEFPMGATPLQVLKGVSIEIAKGETVALMGPSGSGKSTLLNLIGGLDLPTSGRIEVGGQNLSELSEDEMAVFRREQVGFVFQSFNLVPSLSALDNVIMPLVFAGIDATERRERAEAALARVGLSERMSHTPTELSGGEQQRVAIARAIIQNPAVILADEPTGNLDTATGEQILELLWEMNRETGQTFLIATHDPEVAALATRSIHVRDGLIEHEKTPGGPS